MADFSMSVSVQVFTLPDTSDHTIDVSGKLDGISDFGKILIDSITGTVKFNVGAVVDNTNSAPCTSGDKIMLDIRRGQILHAKGSAGAETFRVIVIAVPG